MTSALAPVFMVDLPAPVPPRYSLVGSAAGVGETDEHWQMGGAVLAYPLSNAVGWTGDPISGSPANKPAANGNRQWQVAPFEVVATFGCTRRGIVSEFDFRNRALAAFAAYEVKAVEHQFWVGDLNINMPHLDSDGVAPNTNTLTVLNGGTAAKPALGLALLEQAIADASPNGMIHLRPAVASMLAPGFFDLGISTVTTELGTPVVIGSGYPGTGKDAAAITAQNEWAYASGVVQMRRGDVRVLEMLDRSQNDWLVTIEREYLLTWDTALQVAVKIDKAL